MKPFHHNGGTWLRPDIPSPNSKVWSCAICKKQISSEEEKYYAQQGFEYVEKVRFIPASRYWNGTVVGIEYCSPECALKDLK